MTRVEYYRKLWTNVNKELYLVVEEIDEAIKSETSRRQNCICITTSKKEAIDSMVMACLTERSAVGMITPDGKVIAKVYAYDPVRCMYYTDPIVTNGELLLEGVNGMLLFVGGTWDNTSETELPAKLVRQYEPKLHDVAYWKSICTTHA